MEQNKAVIHLILGHLVHGVGDHFGAEVVVFQGALECLPLPVTYPVVLDLQVSDQCSAWTGCWKTEEEIMTEIASSTFHYY